MKKIIITIFAIVFLSLGVLFLYNYKPENLNLNTQTTKTTSAKNESPIYRTKIFATGDIMYHMPLYKNNYDSSTNTYSFNTYYQKVEEYLKGADLVLGNFESTVNPNRPVSGHPMFNTPPEALSYLKSVGFDALATSNNHCVDTGYDGVKTTLDEMDRVGLKHFGTRREGDKPLIITSNGIAVGLLSYSEMFNGLEGLVPSDKRYELSPLQEDLILGDIQNLKSLGADYIVAYPHWGVEYAKEPSETQKHFEKFLLDNGVDTVLGSHPHVLQRAEFKDGKFTIFSMGNSISNQRQQWIGHQGVESGVFVELNLVKQNNVTKLESFVLHPTYVNRYHDDKGKIQSEVILYSDILEGGKYRELLNKSTQNFVDSSYDWVSERLGILRSE
ncbi:poly-gamma-glutamate synthesis protein (capsule biosynthesis protein) [Peptoniphilus asaccharolyticus DSM 20463]|uniref:Poly-gamma-glutamate synthesis protein (Capsule biosynthesis protein) n=1 Tax=Peptoniphilus asaccharolyticus DSM 20463 TaxID=573058 RepID=A0A1W1V763_PEPAS|nr:CapA family protein [Peptoniphilus asaccharolyticus]MBL7574274.1 CapA family protein [Peptoniphilus asaccharolyticus]MBL7575988.1 CapA family protein [Peptoniphilus asaccharolyticus]MBL7576002.1 CapA family protein [Peptoniphilus asaccharolyticus]MBL7576411.1 CapA family protein [Peptoniphilus asaccharolyticus]SMB88834.1 poly-gamma-glutamate synthesis protein (capsule biosynthesis protein) [Peptoniphilus asaccharolyticus DSM 20463]